MPKKLIKHTPECVCKVVMLVSFAGAWGEGTCRCGQHHAIGSEWSCKGKAEDRGNMFFLSCLLAFPFCVLPPKRFFGFWALTCPVPLSLFLILRFSASWTKQLQIFLSLAYRWPLWDCSASGYVSQPNKSLVIIIYTPLVLFLWKTQLACWSIRKPTSRVMSSPYKKA